MAMAPPVLSELEQTSIEPDLALAHALGILRGIRADAQHYREMLELFKERTRLHEAEARERERAAFLAEYGEIVQSLASRVSQQIDELQTFLYRQPVLASSLNDHAAHIRAHWERALNAWRLASAKPLNLPPLNEALEQLNLLVYQCGMITIPDRINSHLQHLRVGQALDFRAAFEDELPRAEDQRRILEYVSSHPVGIRGVVDVGRALIYHASPSWGRRILSYVAMLIALLGGFGLAVGLTSVGDRLPESQWPIASSRLPELVVAYVFLLLGGGLHVGVDALKQLRSAPAGSLLAIEDWLLWIHVKELPIIGGFVFLWIGLVGLAWGLPRVDWQTAFFVGYSIDSFVDLFLARFTAVAGHQATKVRERLDGARAEG